MSEETDIFLESITIGSGIKDMVETIGTVSVGDNEGVGDGEVELDVDKVCYDTLLAFP